MDMQKLSVDGERKKQSKQMLESIKAKINKNTKWRRVNRKFGAIDLNKKFKRVEEIQTRVV